MISYRPEIVVPDFWVVRPAKIYSFLESLPCGEVVNFGKSAGGRDLLAVLFEPEGKSDDVQIFLIIGGTHGHEPGTNASCVNLINILCTGKDLRGKDWRVFAGLRERLRFIVVPMLNPDGRERCPDSFTGFSRHGTKIYERGLYNDGTVIGEKELVDGVNPDDVLILGGRYNDAGFLMNRPRSIEHTNSVEVQQLLNFLDSHKPDCAVDLHACGWNFFIMTRTFPENYREKLRGIASRFRCGEAPPQGHSRRPGAAEYGLRLECEDDAPPLRHACDGLRGETRLSGLRAVLHARRYR